MVNANLSQLGHVTISEGRAVVTPEGAAKDTCSPFTLIPWPRELAEVKAAKENLKEREARLAICLAGFGRRAGLSHVLK